MQQLYSFSIEYICYSRSIDYGSAGDLAQFVFVAGIVMYKDGNLFVADQNRIRKITRGGIVSTFVGNVLAGYVDGQPDQAMFALIEDMVIDGQGNIYVSENNHIRKISPQGIVSTLAGSTEGYKDGDGRLLCQDFFLYYPIR